MLRAWREKRKHIQKAGFGLAAVLTVSMLILAWIGSGFLWRLENASLDLRFKFRGPRPAANDIVLVAVDERSLKEEGRWPWSRDKQARLVRALTVDGAKVIGLDIIYTEPEITEYLHDLQNIVTNTEAGRKASPALRNLLNQKLAMADTDRQFVESLTAAKNVVLALPLVVPETTAESVPAIGAPDYVKRTEFMLVRQSRSGEAMEPYLATNIHAPLKPFADQAVSLGHVYSLPDRDGITRHEILALRHEDGYYPSFSLEIARIHLGVPKDRMALILGEGVRLGDLLIPTDQKARLLINHLGRERTFPYISATDVLHGRVPAGTFRGKAVLVGTSALGTYDQKSTPFSNNFPGFEKNATVVENIIHGHFLQKGVWTAPADAAMILLFGLGLGYALPRLRASLGSLLAAFAVAGYGLTAQYLFEVYGLWLDVVAPLLTIAIIFVALTVIRFRTEEKQSRQIRSMFSSYVSPRIVEELIKDPSKATLGGQRKELTMLFSDLTGFTAFSEKRAAEEVVGQLNEYLGAMTDVVFRWNGTLDKFVGDAIVVFWGAPLDQPDHVELAVKCALHMRKRLAELQDKWKAEGKVPLDAGIGLNTGTVLVGNIGAEGKKMDYTMIGDNVNLAARVEQLTRRFKTPIVVTSYTAERLKILLEKQEAGDNRGRLGHVSLRRLGEVMVRGRGEPVVVYALESLRREEVSRIQETVAAEAGEPAAPQ